MGMTFDEVVTHVFCFYYECHLIIVEDIPESLDAARYNTLLLINSLA